MAEFAAVARNSALDDITNRAFTLYAHAGDPGAAHTTNRTGNSSGYAMTAANWSTAASGSITYNANINLGVLNSSGSTTVTHVTLFVGSAFWIEIEVDPGNNGISVAANSSANIPSGTITLTASTAA